jgi:hypothetical protein
MALIMMEHISQMFFTVVSSSGSMVMVDAVTKEPAVFQLYVVIEQLEEKNAPALASSSRGPCLLAPAPLLRRRLSP